MASWYRIALSFKHLEAPAPRESTPEVWAYEIEATGPEAALSQAEQEWQDEHHVQPGGGSPKEAIIEAIVAPA
jgi:hypothetical protein